MEYQVSARKYRPAVFDDVIGQPHVVQTLTNAIATNRIAHAFLFSGSRGVGKTTIARILAKALNCEQGPTSHPCGGCANCTEIANGTSVDVIEIDGASNTSVDDVREIRENIKFTPFRGQYRVYIIDEVHMLSNSAFNALLKTLEEPPAHVVFVFATTEIHKIPATILSRCQHYNFRRIPRTEIVHRLRYVADQDGLTVEDRSLASIARASEGSMRDALSLLDQAVSFGGKTIKHDDIASLLGSVPQESVREFMTAVVRHDGPRALNVIARLLDQGHDLRAFTNDLVEHVRNLLVASVVPAGQDLAGLRQLIDLSDDELRQLLRDAQSLTTAHLNELFRIFSEAEDGLRVSAHPRFVLEIAAVRATHLGTTDPVRAGTHPPVSPRAGSAAQDERQNKGTQPPPVGTAIPAGRQTTPAAPAARQSRDAETPVPARVPPPPAPHRESGAPDHVSRASARPPVAPTPPTSSTVLVWERVVERVEHRHPSIGPFLAMARFIGMEANTVTIGYPPSASVALDRVQKDDSIQMISAICSEVAGVPVQLRVIQTDDVQAAAPSVSELRAAKERDQKSALLDQTRAHPLVRQALAIFGGEVSEIRPVLR